MVMFKHSQNWRDSITNLHASTLAAHVQSCPSRNMYCVCLFVCWTVSKHISYMVSLIQKYVSSTHSLFLMLLFFFFIRELTASWLKSNHHPAQANESPLIPSLLPRLRGRSSHLFIIPKKQFHFSVFHSFFKNQIYG